MNNNWLVGCMLVTLRTLLYVGDKIPESGTCNYWISFFPPFIPLASPAPCTPALPGVCPLTVGEDGFSGTGACLRWLCLRKHVQSASRSAPLAADVSNLFSQRTLKEVVAFAVALSLVSSFSLTFTLNFSCPLKNKWFCRDQLVLITDCIIHSSSKRTPSAYFLNKYVKGGDLTPSCSSDLFWLLHLYIEIKRLCKSFALFHCMLIFWKTECIQR